MAKGDKWYEPGGLAFRILDPVGIFHEEGLLGWDLFGLDRSSEEEFERQMQEYYRQQQEAELKKRYAIYKMERYLKMFIVVFAIYMFSKLFKN